MKKCLLVLTMSISPLVFGDVFADNYRIVDQDSNDITILRAFVREDMQLGQLIDLSRCEYKGTNQYRGNEYKHFNCAWELANALTGTPVSLDLPVRTVNGRIEVGPAVTPVVEVHTLIALETWEKISEIGFSLASLGGNIFKYQKNQTREVQKVRMRDGRVGLVHRFVMPFYSNGRTSNCTIRTVTFKPFVSYQVPETRTEYRNWDNGVGGGMFNNYFISNFHYNGDRCETPNVVNRESDLLSR